MPFWKSRVIDHDDQGRESESTYFIAEPDEVEAVLTTYDVHSMSSDLHEGTDEVPNVELEEVEEDNISTKSGGWISNFFGK